MPWIKDPVGKMQDVSHTKERFLSPRRFWDRGNIAKNNKIYYAFVENNRKPENEWNNKSFFTIYAMICGHFQRL